MAAKVNIYITHRTFPLQMNILLFVIRLKDFRRRRRIGARRW